MSETGRGATIFGCLGPTLSAEESAFFRDADPFGFILFGRNVVTPEQLRRLTADLRTAVGRNAPIFVDQEGGRVQRLRGPHWAEWLPPMEEVRAARDPVRALWLRYRLIADELRAVGIDGNCAPTLDVLTDTTHPFLKNRCYSDDPAQVASLGRAAADGHLAGGVLPVIKHMPGHGRAQNDSHLDLPRVTTDRATLSAVDFAPFHALRDLPLAMTAHIVFTEIDDQPATCSPTMINLIRQDIGFAGLLMTDDLSMQALSGTVATRAAAAIKAGCDLALYCKGEMPDLIATATAAGSMSAVTQARATAALARRQPPEPVDIAALRAEHSALLQG